ncbi:hypothetical protein F4782DRAFT_478410 [Xylaria castorea]|nr:hypothetical protein F4782DRAFT_478410 [Xylaria castorea]
MIQFLAILSLIIACLFILLDSYCGQRDFTRYRQMFHLPTHYLAFDRAQLSHVYKADAVSLLLSYQPLVLPLEYRY